MLVFALLNWCMAGAAPFVTTWNSAQANETIQLPMLMISLGSNVTIDWGDSSSATFFGIYPAPSHVYAAAGLYNVSMEGQFRWLFSTADPKLVDIVSWGDGFLVDSFSGRLFYGYRNLRVSAPPNTQPVFLPGASLAGMFGSSSFNSTLDWDLTNVTRLDEMFISTPLNQPINFRNTQNVTTIASMFYNASQFNQPFHFDATNVNSTGSMFNLAASFNQVVNLTNTNKLASIDSMFFAASSFNQPITFNVNSVTDMSSMFRLATNFNQPINFPSQLTSTYGMFFNATSFNQPVTLNTLNVIDMRYMFCGASSFTSTLNFTSTSKATHMDSMFLDVVGFDQDLSSWDVSQVTSCGSFCPRCGLPRFSQCVPCDPIFPNNQTNVSVCTGAPSAPSAPSPSGSAVSAAHAAGGGAMLAAVAFIVAL